MMKKTILKHKETSKESGIFLNYE